MPCRQKTPRHRRVRPSCCGYHSSDGGWSKIVGKRWSFGQLPWWLLCLDLTKNNGRPQSVWWKMDLFTSSQPCVDSCECISCIWRGLTNLWSLRSVLAIGDSRAAKLPFVFFEGNLIDGNQRICEGNTAVSCLYSTHFFQHSSYIEFCKFIWHFHGISF